MADTLIFATVAPDELRPNPWNPNEMDDEQYAKATASIREFGFIDPITVRRLDEAYQIIDGEHRWRAAVDEGLARIPIVDLGELEDPVAQRLTIVLNELRGQPNPVKLGSLLKGLMATTKMETLLSTLPYSREAIGQLTSLPTIDWNDMPKPNLPDMGPGRQVNGWVERTYRMPAASARVIDEAITLWRGHQEGADWAALAEFARAYLED